MKNDTLKNNIFVAVAFFLGMIIVVLVMRAWRYQIEAITIGADNVNVTVQEVKEDVEEVAQTYEEKEAEAKEIREAHELARYNHEKSKQEWLDNNPPVDVLFEESRIHDSEYIIEYLKRNKIGGSCALVWRSDVVCVDFGKLVFPTRSNINR